MIGFVCLQDAHIQQARDHGVPLFGSNVKSRISKESKDYLDQTGTDHLTLASSRFATAILAQGNKRIALLGGFGYCLNTDAAIHVVEPCSRDGRRVPDKNGLSRKLVEQILKQKIIRNEHVLLL